MEDQSLLFQFDSQLTTSQSIPPFYLAITSGVDLPEETSFDIYEKSTSLTRSFVAHGKTPLEFVGTTFQDSISSGANYFVGVLPKGSKHIQLFSTPLLHMERVLKRNLEEDEDEKEIEKVNDSNTLPTTREQKVALGSAFGTKKAKKMYDAQNKNKIEVDTLEVSASMLSASVKTANSIMQVQKTKGKAEDRFHLPPLPPQDLDAQKPQHIYPLNKLLPSDLEKELVTLTEKLKSSNVEECQRKFQMLFKDPPLCPLEPLSKGRSLALFFHFLVKLLQLDKRIPVSTETISQFLNCSDRIAYLLVQTLFSPPSSSSSSSSSSSTNASNAPSFHSQKYKLSPQAILRISLYSIVTSLHLFDFKVTLKFLSSTLKISASQAAKYAKQCGCQLETESGSKYTKQLSNMVAALRSSSDLASVTELR